MAPLVAYTTSCSLHCRPHPPEGGPVWPRARIRVYRLLPVRGTLRHPARCTNLLCKHRLFNAKLVHAYRFDACAGNMRVKDSIVLNLKEMFLWPRAVGVAVKGFWQNFVSPRGTGHGNPAFRIGLIVQPAGPFLMLDDAFGEAVLNRIQRRKFAVSGNLVRQ